MTSSDCLDLQVIPFHAFQELQEIALTCAQAKQDKMEMSLWMSMVIFAINFFCIREQIMPEQKNTVRIEWAP